MESGGNLGKSYEESGGIWVNLKESEVLKNRSVGMWCGICGGISRKSEGIWKLAGNLAENLQVFGRNLGVISCLKRFSPYRAASRASDSKNSFANCCEKSKLNRKHQGFRGGRDAAFYVGVQCVAAIVCPQRECYEMP